MMVAIAFGDVAVEVVAVGDLLIPPPLRHKEVRTKLPNGLQCFLHFDAKSNKRSTSIGTTISFIRHNPLIILISSILTGLLLPIRLVCIHFKIQMDIILFQNLF